EDGQLVGANTDVGGFERALDEAGGATGPAVLLGKGGSARAVAGALVGHELRVVAPPPGAPGFAGAGAGYAWSDEGLVRALDGAGLLVDCTTTGLSPETEGALDGVPLERLAPGALVASLVYHREPALLARARRAGLRTMDGAGMLLHQAALALTPIRGLPAPLEVMRTACQTAR